MSIILYDNVTPPVVLKVCNLNLTSLAAGVLLKIRCYGTNGMVLANGGVEFTEADGNKVDSWGNPIYSVIGMARWNPTQGRKGGFGGYYFEYEYNTTRPANQAIGDKEKAAIPYYSLRRGIQEQNPAGKPVQQSTKQETEEENG